MAVKLHPAADAQKIGDMLRNSFLQKKKHNSKTLRKGISISQSARFQFFKEVLPKSEN